MAKVDHIFHFLAVALLLGCSEARADIFKCTDEEGNLMFSQTPCAKAVPPATKEDVKEKAESEESDSTQQNSSGSPTAEQSVAPARDSPTVAACKKQYRDAIDVIDAEMSREYTAEQGEVYRQRLRIFTEKLRQC